MLSDTFCVFPAFYTIQIGDLDRNGKNEIYLGGISNGSRTATLVALDPDEMRGASVEEDTRFQLIDFPPGREQHRILFPRSCTSLKEQYTAIRSMALAEDRLLVEVWEKPFGPEAPTSFYTFFSGLQLRSVLLSDRLRTVHAELDGAGLIKHPPGVAEEDLLSRGIRHVNRVSAVHE